MSDDKKKMYEAAREELKADLGLLSLLRAVKISEGSGAQGLENLSEAYMYARAAVRKSIGRYTSTAQEAGISPGKYDDAL